MLKEIILVIFIKKIKKITCLLHTLWTFRYFLWYFFFQMAYSILSFGFIVGYIPVDIGHVESLSQAQWRRGSELDL